MLHIDFANLQAQHPEYSEAWHGLQNWLTDNPDPTIIDPRVLVRQVGDIPTRELGAALLTLAKEGILRKYYKIAAPSGVLVGDDYESLDQIPETLYDRYQRPFDRDQGKVVIVFRQK